MKKEEKDYYEQTYGKFKFKVPLPKELESAMGLTGESTQFKKMIMSNYTNFYDTIKPPDEGDWLMTHKEYGQTYQEYVQTSCVQVTPDRDVIYLTPISFSKNGILDDNFLLNIRLLCEAYFPGMKIRTWRIDNYIDIDNVKGNENGKIPIVADQFIACLAKEVPQDAFCLIGIADAELYNEVETKDGKIYYKPTSFGRDIANRINIISICKYNLLNDEKQMNKIKRTKIAMFVLKRLCKVVLKEICVMFGMKNCIYFTCNMNGTGSMTELDNKPFEICPICLRKLITNINAKGEDIKRYRMKNSYVVYDRFVKLRDVLEENFYGVFDNEINWLNVRINALSNEL